MMDNEAQNLTGQVIRSWTAKVQSAWNDLNQQRNLAPSAALWSMYRGKLHTYGSLLASTLDQASLNDKNYDLFNLRKIARDKFLKAREGWHEK